MLIAVPAFAQLAYQIDVGQNGTFETGGYINLGVSQSVTMDIYVSGYTCSPGNGLLGTLKHILLDESKVSVSGFAYDTDNLGPWDAGFSDFFQDEPNVYNLSTGDFDFVTVVGGIQKLGTITLTGTANGCFTMRVANDLTSSGYAAYNDGFISDCNLASRYPADAVLNVAVGAVAETDGDGVADCFDNCPSTPNPGQEDIFPPGGNSCGDACECEGNFDSDLDVDGADASNFKQDFGRSVLKNPCSNADTCNGDFDCDIDVDGANASKFKSDFGRSGLKNPCPNCATEPWCVY
jgi:hypothetical protein